MVNEAITKNLEDALSAFRNSGFRSIIGAENAWRGFWHQALYICGRAASDNEAAVYLPETVEDLLVISEGGTNQECIEFVQIKSIKTGVLHLNNLSPKNKNSSLDEDDSFFGHIYSFWKQGFNVSARVVVFGNVGQEMSNTNARLSSTGSLRRKMIEQHGYPEDYCDWLKEHLSVEQADEPTLESILTQSLNQRIETTAAVSLARNYIMSYIYSCCRCHTAITEDSWKKTLANFGLQASSVRGYLENYGHTIVPMSEYLADSDCNASELETAYRAGTSAMPEHIALALDSKRPTWQSKINNAFESKNVAVVRASSGQGKSTLCYRWLMDHDTINQTYLLNGISPENAPGIVAALRGLANQEDNIYAYIEAGPDTGWVELCTEVYRLNRPNLKILVSVREDDAARACYDPSRVGSADIFLRFDQREASELYERFKTSLFPSFESAWRAFGGDGPLMEFIYSLNHETTLRQKLAGQVQQLRMTGCDSWLIFLYLASVAGEYGLPSSIAKLKEASGFDDVQQMLEVLENEMLLRSDTARELVLPLHPYRSKLLAEIISPMLYQSEEELVLNAAKCAYGNFALILIPYLSEHSFSNNGLDTLAHISEASWSASMHAIKAMVWRDARRFYLSTAEFRQQMKSEGLPISLLCMIARTITEGGNLGSYQSLLGLFRDEAMRRSASSLVAELANREADYKETNRLLSKLAKNLPSTDLIPDQASDAGFVLAYIGERGFKHVIPDNKMRNLADVTGFKTHEVDATLDLLIGYSSIGIDIGDEERRAVFLETCRKDGIVWLDSSELVPQEVVARSGENYEELPSECLDPNGMVRQVNAIVAPRLEGGVGEGSPSDLISELSPNDVVMRSICDLRRLFPNRGRYCVQYSGIRALAHGLEIPDCEKHIPEKNLRLNWTKLINQYYFGMCALENSPARDWEELEDSLRGTISDSIKALSTCSHLMDAALGGKPKATKALQKRFEIEGPKAKKALDEISTDLPLCAQDAYAFTSGQARAFTVDGSALNPREEVSPAFGLKKGANSILGDTRSFLFNLQNHFNNINDMILYAIAQGERPPAIAVTNIAQACAKAKVCNSEFSKLFSGKQLMSEKQKEELLMHAAYWNYLWCRKSRSREQTLFKQGPRVKALREIPERLVKRLRTEKDIVSVSLSDQGMIEVNYKASSNILFSEVAIKCIRDILNCESNSDKHLLEWWLLYHGTPEGIEVTFTSNGHNFTKRFYRFSALINHMDEPFMAEILSPAEVLFDENDINNLEKAEFSFLTTLQTGELLLKCIIEVNNMVSSHKPDGTNAALGIWKEWRESAVKALNKLLVHLDNVIHAYPDEFRNSKSLVDEFRAIASALFQQAEEQK